MANVRLKDLFKNYGKLEIVHGINLNLKDKEFVVFVGSSGCDRGSV